MATVVASTRPLLADLAITERSRRFYDGTYQWDSDGFTDEHGVYRKYDCMDPLARAPTPLPPIFLFDDGDEYSRTKLSDTEAVHAQDRGSAVGSTDTPTIELDASPLKMNTSHSTTLTTGVPRTPGSIRRFAINLLTKPKRKEEVPEDERHVESHVPENTMDIPEGTEPGSEPGEIVEVLHRSYDRCKAPRLAEQESSSIKLPDTPPASPTRTLSVIQDTSPASSTSTLSPVPSILSEQGKDEGIKGASTIQSIPSLPTTPTKKKGTTTRGVAQKVNKSSKWASASNSSPPKWKENSVEEFTLRELHSGALMRKGGLRRSVRQANPIRK